MCVSRMEPIKSLTIMAVNMRIYFGFVWKNKNAGFINWFQTRGEGKKCVCVCAWVLWCVCFTRGSFLMVGHWEILILLTALTLFGKWPSNCLKVFSAHTNIHHSDTWVDRHTHTLSFLLLSPARFHLHWIETRSFTHTLNSQQTV